MKVGGTGVNTVLLREIANTRTQMADLQAQISSMKTADTYGGLGNDRTTALALRQEMSSLESFRETVNSTKPRVKVMTAVVEGLREHASNTRSELLVGGYDVTGNEQTLSQKQAKNRLADAIDMLNTEVNGRHLFSGTKIDAAPLVSADAIINGAGGKAGFTQVMSERKQADLGADGMGRLDIATLGGSVSLAEDAAASPFGFKLSAVNSGLTGTTIAGPGGLPQAIGVDFSATLPQNGESITLTLNLPDGTTSEVSLTASNDSDLGDGQFAIGADAGETAANFSTALTNLLKGEASTNLAAASMQAAADDFFTSGTDIPQRVDGPPFDSATGLRDATDADTMRWYQGELSDEPARESAVARVGHNQFVTYGARADEAAFSNLVKQLAVMSAATFSEDDAEGYAKYSAMTERVGGNLGNSVKADSLDRVIGELAVTESHLGTAEERHATTDNMLTGFLAEIETTDVNQAGAKLLSLQTQLEASYQITSMLSKLSLVNYM